jgi:chemotaxis protein methyltransferase CheR
MKDYSFILDETRMDSVAALVEVPLHRFDPEFLARSFESRMSDNCFCEIADYFRILEKSAVERSLLMDAIMVSYSAFCRNPLTYVVLEEVLLPMMVMQKAKSRSKELRIWSAACASGQEVYCLAMMMEEMEAKNRQSLKYRIFGTDFNKKLIQKAWKGAYPSSELGNITWERMQKWFKRSGDNYCVVDELRTNLDFSVFDLFSDAYTSPPSSVYGGFDLVMCANLLFYYKRAYRVAILSKIVQGMNLPGFLVTGETERQFMLQLGFREVYPSSAIFAVEYNTLSHIRKLHKTELTEMQSFHQQMDQ